MKKVVYNSCYGGFGISRDCLYLYYKNGGPVSRTPIDGSGYTEDQFGLTAEDGIRANTSSWGVCLLHDGFVISFDVDDPALRSHPALVHAVETLGSKAASGSCARLDVAEISDSGLYRIDEYDGLENVIVMSNSEYVSGYTMDTHLSDNTSIVKFLEKPND